MRPTAALVTLLVFAPAFCSARTKQSQITAPIVGRYRSSIILFYKKKFMSVVKSKRKESSMLFYHTALELRRYLTFRILKDFGIKPHIRERSILAESSGLSQEEQVQLNTLLDKCSSVEIIDEFPQWYIEHERTVLLNIMDDLFKHIISANTIYITTQEELRQRRNFQTLAIADCQRLNKELNFIIDIIPSVQADKLKPFVELTLKEINLLKGWRKSNKIAVKERSMSEHSVASSSNFCNANNNGNANNNNASNSNGVRPDLMATTL